MSGTGSLYKHLETVQIGPLLEEHVGNFKNNYVSTSYYTNLVASSLLFDEFLFVGRKCGSIDIYDFLVEPNPSEPIKTYLPIHSTNYNPPYETNHSGAVSCMQRYRYNQLLSGSVNGTVHLYDLETMQLDQKLSVEGRVHCLDFSYHVATFNCDLVAIGNNKGGLPLYDLRTSIATLRLPHIQFEVLTCKFLKLDSYKLLTAGKSDQIVLSDIRINKKLGLDQTSTEELASVVSMELVDKLIFVQFSNSKLKVYDGLFQLKFKLNPYQPPQNQPLQLTRSRRNQLNPTQPLTKPSQLKLKRRLDLDTQPINWNRSQPFQVTKLERQYLLFLPQPDQHDCLRIVILVKDTLSNQLVLVKDAMLKLPFSQLTPTICLDKLTQTLYVATNTIKGKVLALIPDVQQNGLDRDPNLEEEEISQLELKEPEDNWD